MPVAFAGNNDEKKHRAEPPLENTAPCRAVAFMPVRLGPEAARSCHQHTGEDEAHQHRCEARGDREYSNAFVGAGADNSNAATAEEMVRIKFLRNRRRVTIPNDCRHERDDSKEREL